MRTALDLDEDVLLAAKELAVARRTTAGKVVVSDLARQVLTPARTTRIRNGVPVLSSRPAGAVRPTMKHVNDLRDDP